MSKIDLPQDVTVMDLTPIKLYFKWNDYDRTWDLTVVRTSEYFGGDNLEIVYTITPPTIGKTLYEEFGKYREADRVVEMYLHNEIHQ